MANEKRLNDAYKLEDLLRSNSARYHHKDDVIAAIAELPTVDAVLVIRCFECRKEGTEDCPMVLKDGLTRCLYANTKGTDFCSYGERREGE